MKNQYQIGRAIKLFGAIVVAIFLFQAAMINEGVAATHTGITGFPIPLKWNMTKRQIESVIASNNLNLAYSKGKSLESSSFAYGKFYTWAVIKEEHLIYFGKRRFIMLRLDENDRLVSISMKLIPSGNSAHLTEFREKAMQRVKEQTCGTYNKDNSFFKTAGCVWKISDSTWLEMQMQIYKAKSEVTSRVILHWIKP